MTPSPASPSAAGPAGLLRLHETTPPDAPTTVLQVRPANADDGADGDRPPLAEARLHRAIGLDRPRFWFHVGCTVHASEALGLFQRQRTLLLNNDHTGASELELHPGDGPDVAAALRLALHGALLLVAERRERHAARLVSELPGPRDAQGRAPFWQGLGRHFYDGDPALAAQRHGTDWKSGVAALLPRQAVYAAFLAPEAEAAIAQVHAPARALRELLEDAGLRYGHHVAIDDGGPVLEAEVDALAAVAQARACTVGAVAPELADAPWHWLLAVPDGRPATALRGRARLHEGLLQLEPNAARALGANPGTRVRVLPAQAA